MRALLLTVVAFVALEGSLLAQNMPPVYNWEVGINGGLSVITRPLGPAIGYQGTSTNIVHDYSARITRYFNEHWFLTFDLGDRKWETFGNWTPNTTYGQTLKTSQVSFLEASNAISESFEFNYTFPFYTHFHTFNRSNLYAGVMLGMVTTMNDGSMGYIRDKNMPDSGNVNSYHYGYGVGLSYGLQIGYTYYIVPRLGFTAELAVRYAGVATHNDQYGGENANFHLLYFPETVGIRWRF